MTKQKLKSILYWPSVITLGIVLGISLQITSAWTEPTVAPPGGNVGAPINTGASGQSKAGGLILNTDGAVNGLIVSKGNVGIGTTNPLMKLDVAGAARATQFAIDYSNVGVNVPAFGVNNASNKWVYGIFPKLAAGGYNQISGKDDVGFIFSGGAVNSNRNLVIAPWSNSASGIKIMANGNVGIGTATPDTKLDVNGTIRTTGLQLTTGAGAGKVLTSNATGGATWQVAGVSSSNAYNASNGNTTNMGVHNFCVLSTVNNDQDGNWMGCAVSGDVNKAWSLRSIGAGSAVCRAMCFD